MDKVDKKGTILLVEGRVGFRRIYHDILVNDGYEVLEAGDGEAGWELAKTKKPDLILLDLVLPKLHGFEVLKKIRADETTKEIPVIILSVLGEQKDIQKGLELGANDYTVKGFYSSREILRKIGALLARTDIKKHISSYRVSIKEGKIDAAKLQHDMGITKLFQCPHCTDSSVLLELIPDYTRAENHWFSAHFVCPKCKKSF